MSEQHVAGEPAAPFSHSIARSLAEDIVAGLLLPGRKLDETSLARRFKVSRSPVRDALRDLAAMGLVSHLPRRGFSVIEINPAELDDLFEAASEIEALCARICAMQAGTDERARLDQVHREGLEVMRRKDAVGYARCNELFHAAIFEGTGNRTLHEVATELRQQLSPFRAQGFYTPVRLETSWAEHDAILTSILARDGEAAAEAMRRHLAGAALNVIRHFRV